ncbi:MAG: ribosome biogenesis GTP-binding protein YihA/YsxC [Lachnospiraceae bacterium]|nr:ribosome biogenesis GTP-binding protein YihA/YsxC [Lachnospiraceae bacterium]
MVIRSVDLETVIGVSSKIPQNSRPEVAFAGRSNVGKSSLINTLMGRKSYARVSAKPGKTQTINYYNVNGEVYIVDLPGYGYASVSGETRIKWAKMTGKYFRQSEMLRMVFLLVDSRREPSDSDRSTYEWICDNGFSPAIIATKTDKLKKSQIPAHIKAIREGLDLPEETPLVPFSSETKEGREEVWELIERYVIAAEQDQQ